MASTELLTTTPPITTAAATAINASGYLTQVNPSVSNGAISPYNMVPLSSVVKANWGIGAAALPRYNGYSAVEIVGNSAPGFSTGQAMQVMEGIINGAAVGVRSRPISAATQLARLM